MFLVLWAVLLVLKALGALHPLAQPVVVERGHSGSYPVVRGPLRPAPDRPSQLRPGDQLVSIGATSVDGDGQVGVLLAMAKAGAGKARDVPVTLVRGTATMTVQEPMPLRVSRKYLAEIVVSIISGTAAALVLIRARPSRATQALFAALVVDALIYLNVNDMPPPWYTFDLVLGVVLPLLSGPLLLRALMAFPEEAHGLEGAWRWLPVPLGIIGIPIYSAFYGLPLDPATGVELTRALLLLAIIVVMLVLARNYRRSGPAGKRQVKWLMFAIYLGAVLSLSTAAFVDIAVYDPPLWATAVMVLSKAALPVGVLIAALRFDLFDIDRLFGATILYNVLAALTLGIGFLVVPRAADLVTAGLDVGREVAQTVLTLGLAGFVLLAGRRLRLVVERRFFSERYALDAAMRELPERFASVRRAEALWELTGNELAAILRPVSCVIFASAGDAYVPVFSSGDAHAPVLPRDTPLIPWAHALTGAQRIERGDQRRIGAMGMTLLAELDTQVVIPVQRGAALEAMICVGSKRSGDIYTATDLALLTALGKTLSSHMLRFDEAELLERARTMQQRMRRYVPGALADAIAEGDEIETGEREVSVLFVDIRGYTAYADGRDAREIFSTVNRYTECVSAIVREEGGVVVEFNGDGMMAVFGAPRPLAQKEAAAVRAGVRLAQEVRALSPQTAGDAPLTVGVGIATGQAFVGNIEAVDRTIWSAIGNTTNLAARLQSLTRTLGASVLVDERTHGRAGSITRGFTECAPLEIRGRSARETVYALAADTADAGLRSPSVALEPAANDAAGDLPTAGAATPR